MGSTYLSYRKLTLAILFRIAYLIRRNKLIRLLLIFVTVFFFLDTYFTLSTYPSSQRLVPAIQKSDRITEKIYIASIHWNDEKVLREHWIAALLDLVRQCDDVYVSVFESGSWDNTKGALTELDEKLGELGIERNIVLSNRTHEDEVTRIPSENEPNWVIAPSGKKEMRRIPFLAETRNQAMKDLEYLSKRPNNPRKFERVIWLNDIIFTPSDVKALLATNHGLYSAACPLDFSDPPLFYDSFAIRDSLGNPAISQVYPYFQAQDSREATVRMKDIPVKSCWNGLTIFNAESWYSTPEGKPGVKFRGIPDGLAEKHLEGSECCLIHADNPLTKKLGVWLNPNVRVSYNEMSDRIVNPKGRGGVWPTQWVRWKGVWIFRWRFWYDWSGRLETRRLIQKRIAEWREETKKKGGNEEELVGEWCLVDEMQILVYNGWKHVRN